MSDPIEDAQKPVELGVTGIESKEAGMGGLPIVPAQTDILTPPPPPGKPLTGEEVKVLNEGCERVLREVLDWFEIEYALVTTETSQSGSGPQLQLNCKWAFEHMPSGKMYKGSFFFTPEDKPEDAKQIIAMQITLGGNPMGAGYYIMADAMARFGSPNPQRNSPPEIFVRAVITDMKKSGKISWMQAPQALAQVLHIEENINEIYGVDTGELMKQAGAAKKIQIAKK